MLKSDFHIHTREDPVDKISYSAKDIIRYAAKLNYKVLSITNHHRVTYNGELKQFAEKKGIILISGAEVEVEGKEILLLNAEKYNIRDFSSLEKLKNQNALIIAPHVFYPGKNCLGSKLIENIDLFDAVEYCHFYHSLFNRFNQKAVRTALKYKKTLIGTSDAHFLFQFNRTYSLVDAELNKDSVLEAVRKNKVLIRTRPLPLRYFLYVGFKAAANEICKNHGFLRFGNLRFP